MKQPDFLEHFSQCESFCGFGLHLCEKCFRAQSLLECMDHIPATGLSREQGEQAA
ncbi:MAG: hypothetical protein QOH35_847 [Acidobacteriaceae bacterium]|nr:hypothetical protein [Acidobacteriaceae bacterium]